MKKLIIILMIFLTSCASINYYNEWKEYVVKKGKHESNMPTKIVLQEDYVKFAFVVDTSWYYDVPDSINGVSKICGITFGNVHKNSARVGFICERNELWLFGYCYVNGISPQENSQYKKRLFKVTHGDLYRFRILRHEPTMTYKFFIDNEEVWSCPCGNDNIITAVNTPYIGGRFTLAHDVKFEIAILR